jgi:predicted N-formylglutamate amidohydrolase
MHRVSIPQILADEIPDEDGGETFEVIGGSIAGATLIIADHASNAIPAEFDNLGMSQAQLKRHIAYDIGIEWMARAMARQLAAPAVLSRFSRLLIDPNRGDDDPTLVMRLSDGAVVPGNARIGEPDILERMQRFSLPYHLAITGVLDSMMASAVVPVVVSLHSFTPEMKGLRRPWQVGILWDSDPRLPLPFIASLRRDTSLMVGDNEPYDGALAGDTMSRHCIGRGLPHILIEIRQDLIACQSDAIVWAERLVKDLKPLLDNPDLHCVEHFGTRAG